MDKREIMTEETIKKVCISILIGMMMLILVALVSLCNGCGFKMIVDTSKAAQGIYTVEAKGKGSGSLKIGDFEATADSKSEGLLGQLTLEQNK